MSDNTRVVRSEWGLLYGGVFNKIRFPGRYQVDDTGTKVEPSEYNVPEVAFTGDIGELYAEPDTFYVDAANTLLMRKRKRDDEGNTVDVRDLKVGKLDLALTDEFRDAFLSEGEARQILAEQTEQKFRLFQQTLNQGSTKQELVDAITAFDGESVNKINQLREDLTEQLNERVRLGNLKNSVLAFCYSKAEIDRRFGAGGAQNERLVAESGARTAISLQNLRENLRVFSESSKADFKNLLDFAEKTFVTEPFLDTRLNNYYTKLALDNRLNLNYYTQSEVDGILNDLYLKKTVANNTYYTRSQIDSMIGAIDGVDPDLGSKLSSIAAGYLDRKDFVNELGSKFVEVPEIARQSVVDQTRNDLNTQIEFVRDNVTDLDSYINGARSDIETLRGRIRDVENQISEGFTNVNGQLQFNDTRLQTFYDSELTALKTRLDVKEDELNTIADQLGLGADPGDRVFAQTSELNDVANDLAALQTTVTNRGTQLDDLDTRETSRYNEFSSFKTTVQDNYVDLTNDAKLTDLANAISNNYNGYSKTNLNGILNAYADAFRVNNQEHVCNLFANFNIKKLTGESKVTVLSAQNGPSINAAPDGVFTETNGSGVVGGNLDIADRTTALADKMGSDNGDAVKVAYNNNSTSGHFEIYIGLPLTYSTRTYMIVANDRTLNQNVTPEQPRPRLYGVWKLQSADYSSTPPKRLVYALGPRQNASATGDQIPNYFSVDVAIYSFTQYPNYGV